jgi:predicted RNase H-like nuclease (RuvC/YqgF family)
MDDNELVVETFIKEQQEMINELSQKNVMLNTKVKYLEAKLNGYDKQEQVLLSLKKNNLQLERKVSSLTNNNQVLNDRIKNGHAELKELAEALEQNKLINKTSIAGFSHTGKIQRK